MSFPIGQQPVKITLYKNIPFNNAYEHHPFLSTSFDDGGSNTNKHKTMDKFLSTLKDLQHYLFPQKEYTNTNNGYNFSYGNGLITSIVMEVDSDFTDSNYMRVEYATNKVYYYFITAVMQQNATDIGAVVKFELELDVIASYTEELLDGLDKGTTPIPLYTLRKHGQRTIDKQVGLVHYRVPYCSEFLTDEPSLSKLVPTKPVKVCKNVETKLQNRHLDNLFWLYIMTTDTNLDDKNTRINKMYLPTGQVCLPLQPIILKDKDDNVLLDYTKVIGGKDAIQLLIDSLWDKDKVHSIRVSQYPPFSEEIMQLMSFSVVSGVLNIKLSNSFRVSDIGNTTFVSYPSSYFEEEKFTISFKKLTQSSTEVVFKNLIELDRIDNLSFNGSDNLISFQTSIDNVRTFDNEIKLRFSPFTKYELKTRVSEPIEIYPEYVLSQTLLSSGNLTINFDVRTSCYTPDYAVTTYINFTGDNISFYKDSKLYGISMSTNSNYTYPSGKDALKSFIDNQINGYATGKLGDMLGSIFSIKQGGEMINKATAKNLKLGASKVPQWAQRLYESGTALQGLGSIGIGSKVIESIGKVIDLTRKADTLTADGSTFIHDFVIGDTSKNDLYPYILVTELTDNEKELVSQYLYNYGYNTNRNCYLNKDLTFTYSNTNWNDTRLFTREIFNYIQLGEDITNKIHSDIPPICKQKISDIFQNGIKLYTLFNLNIANNDSSIHIIDEGVFYQYYENDIYENKEIF